MEALFIFIAKSSGLLVLFYFAYYFLLRKETFFNSNRWFLLIGLVTSVALPFLVYTKIVWVDPTPLPTLNYSHAYIPQTIQEESFEVNWNLVSLAIYAIGFSAFMIKFALDFYSLNSVLKGKKVQQQADFKFVDINENIAPFSYFDYIVYNSSMYTEAELENILEHEKVHSDQNHTIDVLISRVFCVLFWFNPIIWLYKKAILQNLEFIADSEAAKKISDKKAYQYTLLKITTHESCVAITNHFYQSLIKKRIVMLNKNQSKKWNYWKYYAVIPALVAFVLLFQIKVIAQEKKEIEEKIEKEVQVEKKQDIDVYKIRKTTTDQELKTIAEKLKQNHNLNCEISDVKRNAANELTAIKVDIEKGTGKAQTIQIEGNNAIKSCGIVITTHNDGVKKINVITDGGIDKPMVIENRIVEVREIHNDNNNNNNNNNVDAIDPPSPPSPPSPPTMPTFPDGPMPPAPNIDMSKMPKAPKAPKNVNDKVAMKQFEKELEEFEKKMESFEPDLSTYEKQVEEVMSKREAIFEKDMEKYDLAMEKYDADMEKFNDYMEQKYGVDSDLYKKSMKQYEKGMKEYEKNMKEHEKAMKKLQKENKRS
ncbi:M56 family metallopeptidase [Flavobacterium sp. ANB]|uniref:M56 family metallopeptidase n=1 Tax=unclassified Flavobacterium TaxID=196869 RepID=UPI0012B9211B|nr:MULTISPECIES: M56 family metallopeptidase [unclassified Flavobacterium]MBF4516038.1 M56 family metallopeptidase [Flavobacterium sp. ANB]MTD69040.1 peptidase M56 [Flavobacterium sp. LC2016-13]